MKKRITKITLIIALAMSSIFSVGYVDSYFEISKNLDIFATLFRELNIYYVDDADPGKLMKTRRAVSGLRINYKGYCFCFRRYVIVCYTKFMKSKNTIQKGSVRVLVFRDGSDWYAAALELNIVEFGSTSQEALLLLFEAVGGYVESAKKIKARPHILNQTVDSEYEIKWREALELKNKQESVFFAGRMNIGRKLSMASA